MQTIKLIIYFVLGVILFFIAWQVFWWAVSFAWQFGVLLLVVGAVIWALITTLGKANTPAHTSKAPITGEITEAPKEERPDRTDMALIGLAAFTALIGKGLNSLDDVPQIGGSPSSGFGGRTWHDSDGKQIQVGADGSLYYNGKFIGHRDANGRIVDGSGNFIGTLKDSGELHGPNGDFKGRIFG